MTGLTNSIFYFNTINVALFLKPIFRHSCSLISDSEILIVGGDSSGWIYDISSETIRMTNNSPIFQRGFASIKQIGDRILVFGGEFCPKKVEEFRVETLEFNTVTIPILHPRSRFGSAVVPDSFFRHLGCKGQN